MNITKLKYIMTQHGETVKDLADVLGIYYKTLYIKIRPTWKSQSDRNSEFTLSQCQRIAEHYSMTPEEIYEVFFTSEIR